MALSNSQYNAILREYERLQAEERSELAERREEVFRRIPGLKELDRMAGNSAMDRFRRAVKSGTDDAVQGFSEEVRRIEEEKARLIKEAGMHLLPDEGDQDAVRPVEPGADHGVGEFPVFLSGMV